MGRRSKSVENFLMSMEAFCENEARNRKVRTFSDELFVFGEINGTRRRRSAFDCIILGDRRRGKSLAGNPVVGTIFKSSDEEREFYRAIDSKKEFAVIAYSGKTAILYLGLWRSYRLGVISLTSQSVKVTAAALSEDFGRVFEDIWFGDGFSMADEANPCLFINEFMTFKRDMLAASGIDSVDGRLGFDTMLYSAAETVGCDVVLTENSFLRVERIDRDTTATILLCLLSAVRSVSADRRAYVRISESDGDAAISLSFSPYGDFSTDRAVFADFCRSFSELYGIPFSIGIQNGICRVDFIPMRIDPSQSGLKASVIFDFNLGAHAKDSHGAR